MRYAIVENGVVTNVATSDAALEPNWIASDDAQIGYLYDGAVFTPPPVDTTAVETANRSTRNTLLTASDWTQLPDVTLTPECKAEFVTYRQALRDIDLANPVWPAIPAEVWEPAP